MKRKLFIIAASMLIMPAIINAQQPKDSVVNSIKQYAAEVMERWRIPGMAVSMVKDGELIMAKGFGVKSPLGDTVTANSVFQIGSVSKSFTAVVMAAMVDRGLVKWEDSVKNILPDFEMYDKWVEQNMQVKDIMVHRSGLRGQAGTYIPNLGYSREDVYKMLPLIKPKYSFRGSYEYNNITFIIAQKIIEKVSGKSWEENVNEIIFEPLEMRSSSLNAQGFTSSPDVTLPYEFYYTGSSANGDSLVVNPLYGEEQALHWLTVIGPAGSVNSTVRDMSNYIRFHLNRGEYKGVQIISKKGADYLHRGITITSQDSSRTTLYGTCWFVEQNNRYRVIFHTGTTWGMTALCAFVPEIDMGIMILANSEVPSLPRYAVMRRAIDLFYGFETKDYNSEYYKEWIEGERDSFKKGQERSKEPFLPPLANEILVGKYYKDDLFGTAVVEQKNGELFISVGPKGWSHKLKHSTGVKYSFRSDGHEFPVEFQLDSLNKKILSLDIDFGYNENFGKWIKTN